MRALPGPTIGARGSAERGNPSPSGGDGGWMPQPNVWMIPAGIAVLFVGGAWVCDAVTGALVTATGSGEATHYLPVALGLLVALVALVVALFRRETARARRAEAALPVPAQIDPPVLSARTVTVIAEAMNLPRALTAHPAVTYPRHPTEIIDAEIIP